MTYEEAKQKKLIGDWQIVAKICGITPENASITSNRPKAKKYKKIMDALVKVIETREKLIQ